jgi:peptidoglycan/LPS O-acetylase OafA/YrhL
MTAGISNLSSLAVMSSEVPLKEEHSSLPAPENKLYYPALDGLRGSAALLVFLEHYFLYRRSAHFHWGWVGVDLFFVLSGFLITGILFDTRYSLHRVRNFYARRTLRIFPLYYGVFLATLLLTPVFHWAWSRYWLLWPVYLGNYGHVLAIHTPISRFGALEQLRSRFSDLQLSFGHFWTLCIEEQFYLAWPFAVFFLRDRVRLLYLCASVVITMPFLRLVAIFVLPARWLAGDVLYFHTFFRSDALLLGALLALILRGPRAKSLLRFAFPLLCLSLVLFSVAWTVGVKLLHQPFSGDPGIPWIKTFGFTFVDLIAAAIILLAIQPGNLIYRIFLTRPLRSLGKISYGFYIFHDLFHSFYQRLATSLSFGHQTYIPAITPALAFASTILIASLSFQYFESPFLRLKDRWTV